MWSRKSNKLGSRQNSAFQGVEEGEADDDVANGMFSKPVPQVRPLTLSACFSGIIKTTYS